MTERPGSRRLTAAVLLTPAAAAILAGSLAWASGNPPEAALKPSSATPSAADATAPGATATGTTGDDIDATLKKRIRAVERMRKQVASLRAELAKLEKLEIPEGDSSSGSGTATPPRRTEPKPKPKPKPKPTRTAAPPPVDANTGAS